MPLPRAVVAVGLPGEIPAINCLPLASILLLQEVSFQNQLGRLRTSSSSNSAPSPQRLAWLIQIYQIHLHFPVQSDPAQIKAKGKIDEVKVTSSIRIWSKAGVLRSGETAWAEVQTGGGSGNGRQSAELTCNVTQVENGSYETVMDARAEKQPLMGRSKDQEQGLYTTTQKAVQPLLPASFCCAASQNLSLLWELSLAPHLMPQRGPGCGHEEGGQHMDGLPASSFSLFYLQFNV